MKRPQQKTVAGAFLFAAMIPAAIAAEPVIYPAKGQSAKQQSKDKYECYEWAVKQTGFDPQAAGTAAPPSSESKSDRSVGKGAAGGALGGAITGHAGRGAAVGAGIGGLRHREKEKQAKQDEQQAEAKQQEKMSTFNEAQKVCLKGRGYSVE
jgi:hypothetical protein